MLKEGANYVDSQNLPGQLKYFGLEFPASLISLEMSEKSFSHCRAGWKIAGNPGEERDIVEVCSFPRQE